MNVGGLDNIALTVYAEAVSNTGIGGGVSVVNDADANIQLGDVKAGEYGIEAMSVSDASITVTAGDVTAEGNGVEASVSGNGLVAVTVDSVSAKKNGIVIDANEGSPDEGNCIDILVKKTVAGDSVGIALVPSGEQYGELSITAWEIKPNDNGYVVMSEGEEEDALVYDDAAKTVEKSIQYIIQLESPKEGVTLGVTDENGQALKQVGNESVARQDEKVLMKINVYDGYTLTGVYNGKGERTEVGQDAAGNYYIMVPKGGGVYLSVTLEKTLSPSQTPKNASLPTPAYTNVAAIADTGVVTKFDAALGCYSLTLTARSNSITFLRQTLEKFQKISDNFLIVTPSGSCTVLLSEILNFNEKAVNFRLTYTGSGVEVFSNGELCKSIGAAEMV